MAKFQTHVTFGVLWAVIYTAGIFCSKTLGMVPCFVTAVLSLIGAALPDIDSDNARPTRFLFGILGAACPILLIQYLPKYWQTDELFCFMILAYLFFQYVLSALFAAFTEHRGIIHSIPAAVIFGELTWIIFHTSSIQVRLIYSGGIMGGYFVHLILDEIFSVDLFGMRLKKSAGSALSFKGDSVFSTAAAYVVILVLGYVIYVLY